MKNIILIIFIFFVIYPIKSQSCEKESPSNENECFNNNIEKKYTDFCCYFKGINPKDNSEISFCKSVPYSSYFKGYNHEYLDGILYSVKCQDNQNLTTYSLAPCGNVYEKSEATFKKCKQFSTFVDSCCYFSGEDDDFDKNFDPKDKLDKGCYWLGTKYDKEVWWAGSRLKCHNNYLNYSLFYFLSFIISMILFF